MPNFRAWQSAISDAYQHEGEHGAIRLALRGPGNYRAAVLTSFGIESAVLLKLVSEVDRAAPAIFLETGKHFTETLQYAERLSNRLGLTNVRYKKPNQDVLGGADPNGDLWSRDPDRCCFLRKVLPLRDALAGFQGSISGRKQFQSNERAGLELCQVVDDQLQINPLVDWTQERIDAVFDELELPRHPLEQHGYLSIGCAPCTAAPADQRDPRSGRWPGFEKTECGIHESYWEKLKG